MFRGIDRAVCTGETKENTLMKPLPNIGFDRFIARSWLDLALAVAAGQRDRADLVLLLEQDVIGLVARSKTSVVINRMWLSPHPTLVEYVAEGVSLYKSNPNIDTMSLHWAMALRSHPLFASIADSIGRLIKLHCEFTSSQVLRRIKEQYGDRASVIRATAAVIQTLVAWGVIKLLDPKQRRFGLGQTIDISKPEVGVWVIEAGIDAVGNSVALNAPINPLFPFKLPNITEAQIDLCIRIHRINLGSGDMHVGLKLFG